MASGKVIADLTFVGDDRRRVLSFTAGVVSKGRRRAGTTAFAEMRTPAVEADIQNQITCRKHVELLGA